MQLDSQEAEKNSIIVALEAEKAELVELQKNNESEIKVLREKADNSENLVCIFLFNLLCHPNCKGKQRVWFLTYLK